MSLPLVFESIVNDNTIRNRDTTTPSHFSPLSSLSNQQQHCTFVNEDQTKVVTAKTEGNNECKITLLKRLPSIDSNDSNNDPYQNNASLCDIENGEDGERQGQETRKRRRDESNHLFMPRSTQAQWNQQFQKIISFPNKKSFSIIAVAFSSSSTHSHHAGSNVDVEEEYGPVLFLLTKNGLLHYVSLKNITNDDDDDDNIEIILCQMKCKSNESNSNEARFYNDNFLLGMNLLSVKLDSIQGMYKNQQLKNHLSANILHDEISTINEDTAVDNCNEDKDEGRDEHQQYIPIGSDKIEDGITLLVAGSSTLNPPVIVYIPPPTNLPINKKTQNVNKFNYNYLEPIATKTVYTLDVPGLDDVLSPITSIQLIDESILDAQTWFTLQSLWENSSQTMANNIGMSTNITGNHFSNFQQNHNQNRSVIIMGFQNGNIYISFLTISHQYQHDDRKKSSKSPSPATTTPFLNISHAHCIHRITNPMQSIVTVCLVPTSLINNSCTNVRNDKNSNNETEDSNTKTSAATTISSTLIAVGSLGNIVVLTPQPSSSSSQNVYRSNVSKKWKSPPFHTISCTKSRKSSGTSSNTFDCDNGDTAEMHMITSASSVPPIFSNYVTQNSDTCTLQFERNSINDNLECRNGFYDVITVQKSSLSLIVVSADCSTYLVHILLQYNQPNHSSSYDDSITECVPFDTNQCKYVNINVNDTVDNHEYNYLDSIFITASIAKLPLRKEMKYVSSQWKISSSLSMRCDETLFLTFKTLHNRMVILMPKYTECNSGSDLSATAKKIKLASKEENDKTELDSNDHIINEMFHLLKKLSSSSSSSSFNNQASKVDSKTSQIENISKQIDNEIDKSRRLLSTVSAISTYQTTSEGNQSVDDVNSPEQNGCNIDIYDSNVLSVNVHPMLKSHPCEKYFKNESLTIHAYESMNMYCNSGISEVSEKFEIVGKRERRRGDKQSILNSRNIYYGGCAQSTSYASLDGILKHGVHFYRWDNHPLQTFVSTFLECEDSTFGNDTSDQSGGYTRGLDTNLTMKASHTKSTMNFHKTPANNCDSICLQIPTPGFDCIDILELLRSNQIECVSQSLNNITSALVLRLKEMETFQHLSSPNSREEKLIRCHGQQYTHDLENYKTSITSGFYSFMAPSFLKSIVFHKNENCILGPALSVNMFGASLVSDPKSKDVQCSAHFAVAGDGLSDVESVLKLIEASLKKRLADFCQLKSPSTTAIDSQKEDVDKLLDVYRSVINDPKTKSLISYLKKLGHKSSLKNNPTSSEVMEYYRKLRAVKIFMETEGSK